MTKEKEEDNKFYTAKFDRVFKTIFCDEDNPSLLKELLERIFKKKIESIEFLRSELPVVSVVDRSKTVDVLVKVDNEYLHIELNCNYKNYLHTRNFIYFTNIYSRKTVRGKKYDFKTKFIHIDFTYGLSKKIEDVTHYYVMSNNGKKYIHNFEIIEYNMDKITDYWYNLDMEKVKEYKHLIMLDLEKNDLDKISNGDDFVEAYEDKVTDLNNQETFRSFMSYEEDQELIQNTEKAMAYEDGISQGIEQGISQGIEQRNVEIAKNMLAKKMDISTVSELTGLDADTLEKLSKEIN